MDVSTAIRTALALATWVSTSTPAHSPRPLERGACGEIRGRMAAKVSSVVPGWGSLQLRGSGAATGSVDGPMRVVVRRSEERLLVAATIRTDAGELRLEGDATTSRADADALHRVSGELRVTGGTGSYEGVAGEVRTSGHADVATRRLQLNYTGTLCNAAAASGRQS